MDRTAVFVDNDGDMIDANKDKKGIRITISNSDDDYRSVILSEWQLKELVKQLEAL